MRTRGFEVVAAYQDKGIEIPERKTVYSAGYDIMAAEDTVIEPGVVSLVATGLKAFMPHDEYLGIHIRSGLSIKNALSLINSEGIIDADYYNNPGNEGHIMIAFFNHGANKVIVKKGDRIAQGIFTKYFITDGDDSKKNSNRSGGMGSTGK
ncbi:MAG: deoxyUTP pyrophosphatase [Firmicutes bacterium]|nr:deoxyUTP pyrophosphatase [Bacillota bacterium]